MDNMTTVSFDVPSELAKLLESKSSQSCFERNAMLILPFIRDMTISHGRAAEILGVHKLDLIADAEGVGHCLDFLMAREHAHCVKVDITGLGQRAAHIQLDLRHFRFLHGLDALQVFFVFCHHLFVIIPFPAKSQPHASS